MIDLQSLRHRPAEPAPLPEASAKATAADFTVRKMAHHEEWARNPEAERITKATGRAKGAKTLEEHRVLTALRSKPATSTTDLANRAGLNETAAMLTFRTLQDRNLVREISNAFGTTTMVAAD